MENFFKELSQNILSKIDSSEDLMLNFWGEDSHFTRFNQSKVRQNGFVSDATLSITLISNSYSAGSSSGGEGDGPKTKTNYEKAVKLIKSANKYEKKGKTNNRACCSSSILCIAWFRDTSDTSLFYKNLLWIYISIDRSY